MTSAHSLVFPHLVCSKWSISFGNLGITGHPFMPRTTFKFKTYNTHKTGYLEALLPIACDIRNFVLATKKEAWEKEGKNISLYEMQKIVRDRRNENNSSWQMLGSKAVEQIIDRIYNGYTLFFSNLKRGVKASPPKFKSSKKYRSITWKQHGVGWELLEGTNQIRIGKETFKFHKHREIQGTPKTLTAKKSKTGEWFIYITTDYEAKVETPTRTGKSVGLDFGLKTFLTCSDGEKIQSPEFFKQDLRLIRKLSKALSSKVKGSKNWERARLALARAHEKIANKRRNFHYKLAVKLCEQYEFICLETLNLKGMKALWGRKVSDLGFYQFVQILKWEAQKHGCKVIQIDRFYPSSKECSACWEINQDLSLRDREWTCTHCNTKHDRDLNAAQNILRVGLATLAGADVRPSKTGRKASSKKAFGVDRRSARPKQSRRD
jgi:putative transposase